LSYSLSILPRAVKELKRLPPDIRNRVLHSVQSLTGDPRPPQCRKLSGREGFRIRVGDYRVLYDVDDSDRSVIILHVAHRSNAYR
jgi:mRNA interferase RelE/StbE